MCCTSHFFTSSVVTKEIRTEAQIVLLKGVSHSCLLLVELNHDQSIDLPKFHLDFNSLIRSLTCDVEMIN